MKKFIFILCALLVALSNFFIVKPAYALSTYARIINDQTAFYSDSYGLNLVFYLPYTYYVRVLDDSGVFAHVECVGEHLTSIDGYVKKSDLFYDDLPVSSSYVNLKISTCDTAVLYEDSNFDNILQYVFSGREMTYYGSLTKPSGEILYYVSYNGRLGFVKEACFLPFSVPLHPNPLTFVTETVTPDDNNEQQPVDTDTSTSNEGFFNLKFIIIFCLIFAGIVALFIAFSKKSPQKSSTACGYYDENDFE